MAETLRIEIPIETIDKTEPELSNLRKKIGKLGEEAEKAGQKTKKSSQYVSEFDKHAKKTERSLAAWAKEKYQILLEAKERISPILSTLGRGLKGFTRKTWNVTLRAVDFITSPIRGILNLLRNPVFQVGAILGVSIGLKDAIQTYQGFEAAMSQVQAISGATSSDLVKLTNKAKEMGATTKFTAQESAEAFNYMAMAGWKTGDMLSGIEGILALAAASGEDLAITSDIVTDALTAFQMKASDAGRFSDVLAAAASNANTTVSGMGETFKYAGAMAGALGYSIEDVALMTGLMANSGIKGTMAGTAMNAIFTRLSTNASGATDAISALGIQFFTSKGTARDLSDVMGELRNATKGMNAEQKSQLANTIAGTEAQKGLLAILNASEEDYDKLADAISNADGAAKQMSETMLDNLSGSITLLQSAVDGVKISFGERLSPYIRNLADWLTSQMPAIEQGLSEFMDWLDIRMDQVQQKFQEITGTEEWQDADFLGKVKIVWDEFIAEPFSEWWSSTGKAKFAGFAKNIGEGIGSGLKFGIMTLLGIDLGETLEEGVSIGASFAKGFSDGFDFKAISTKLWKGLGGLLSDAGKLLPGGKTPGLSSVVSAVLLKKLTKPLVGLGKGIFTVGKIGKNLLASGEENIGLGSRLLGNFSVADEIAGSGMAGGTGLFGLFGKAGMTLGSSAISSTGLVAAGGGAVMGGIAAGSTLISGVLDAYKAIKSDNKEEAKAYKESAVWKTGGVAAGAAAGMALGSVIPGIGTAIGALVGAGVGGITGWMKGNKIKEEYQENVEEMQKEAERAQKVFQATGFSIENVTFKNQALTQAMNDSEVSAEQFALMFQEECANVAKKAFGDISLSLTEVKKIASQITFADMAKELDEFAKATLNTDTGLQNLQSSVSDLKKENWKVSLGMELSEVEKDSYKNAIEKFLNTSQTFIDDNHYEATVALKLLVGTNADTTSLDHYYKNLKGQLEELKTKLSNSMTIALEDSVITLDEAAELEHLQGQISEITNKLSDAKASAQMQALQIKHNGAALDIDSFHAMKQELQANVAEASKQYESALTLTLTNLNLQLADGAITQEQYDKAAAEATEGYYAQINELNARVSSFHLESIATAWDSELAKIMPEVEGSTTKKLTQALNHALLIHPDVTTWKESDVIQWMGLDKLNLDSVEQTTIAAELIQAALAVPEGTKETILQKYKDSIPTVDEIVDHLNWEEYSIREFDGLTKVLLDSMEELASDKNWNMYQGWNLDDSILKGVSSEQLDAAMHNMANDIYTALEASLNPDIVSEFINDYMTKEVQNGMPNQLPFVRSHLEDVLKEAVINPFTLRPDLHIEPNYHILSTSHHREVKAYAAGGYVSGGPQLSWLAEEGYGEFVIPTNPSRRARAIELYQQAGAALGISAYAAGGYVGGSILSNTASSYNFFNDINRNDPVVYNGNVESNYSEETENYEPLSAKATNTTEGAPIQVNVSMAPEFVIQNSDEQSEEDIIQVIRRHIREMADELGGAIAGKLEEVFSNMPLKEV